MNKVIFIQGIHNFRFRNYLIFKALESIGKEVYYFPMFYSLHQADKHLALINEINSFLEKEEGKFILLGHSFGGVISYSLREDLYEKIDSIITIASPHQVRFKWFKKIINKIPYKKHIKVREQRSYGFLFDTTVPFIFTKYNNSDPHQNLIGTHNFILNSRSLVKKII